MSEIAPNREVENRKSAEEIRHLFECSIDGILLSTSDGAIHAANAAACQILGRSTEEIIRLGRDGLVDSSDPNLPILLEKRRRFGNVKGELNFLRPDRSTFPCEISSSAYVDAAGKSQNIIILRDISERKRAEAAHAALEAHLRESEQQYRLLVMSMEEGVTLQDANSSIIAFNRSAERILGLTAD